MKWLRRRRSLDLGDKRPSPNDLRLELEVNGKRQTLEIDGRRNLLQVLRKHLGLVSLAGDCGRGECGGCMVLIDDEPRLACRTPAVEANGRSVITAEGLLASNPPSTIPEAFEDHEVFFCGNCTSGQMMAAEGLLRAESEPSPKAILSAMSAVECRCGGQHLVYAAVEKAVELRRQQNPASVSS